MTWKDLTEGVSAPQVKGARGVKFPGGEQGDGRFKGRAGRRSKRLEMGLRELKRQRLGRVGIGVLRYLAGG